MKGSQEVWWWSSTMETEGRFLSTTSASCLRDTRFAVGVACLSLSTFSFDSPNYSCCWSRWRVNSCPTDLHGRQQKFDPGAGPHQWQTMWPTWRSQPSKQQPNSSEKKTRWDVKTPVKAAFYGYFEFSSSSKVLNASCSQICCFPLRFSEPQLKSASLFQGDRRDLVKNKSSNIKPTRPLSVPHPSWVGLIWPTPRKGPVTTCFSLMGHPKRPSRGKRMICSRCLSISHRAPPQPRAFSAAAPLKSTPSAALPKVTRPSALSLQPQVRVYPLAPGASCTARSASKMKPFCQRSGSLGKSFWSS